MSDPGDRAAPASNGRSGTGRLRQAAFWIVLLTVFALSTWPNPPDLPYNPSDKLQHAFAFLCLGLLGGVAYPRLSLAKLALALAAFGALIEAVQAIPMLNRRTEFLDWVADVGATALAIALLLAWRALRRKA